MKTLLSVLMIVWCTVAIKAQTASQLVAQSRGLLIQKNPEGARTKAEAALALEPNNLDANALVAYTRLITLANSSEASVLLDRLGFSAAGRNFYFWTSHRGTNPIPSNFSAAELTAFAKTTIIPALSASDANLAKITDTNYVLVVSEAEASRGVGAADYGDILLTRALLHAAQFFFHTLASWNLDSQLTALENFFGNEHANFRDFLAAHPQLLTFANNADLLAARTDFQTAIQLYLDASARIHARTSNQLRFFNLDEDFTGSEGEFRSLLTDLRASLQAPVVLATETNLTVHLARFFEPTIAPRMWLPTIRSGRLIPGTLPDPSFGGVLSGAQATDIESSLGEFLSFGTQTEAQLTPAKTLRLTLRTIPSHSYAIQQSSNLTNWTEIASFFATGNTFTYDVLNPAGAIRYFRLQDLRMFASFSGTVIDACSGLPIANATVSSQADARTAVTDANGRFHLQSRNSFPPYEFQVGAQAPGYGTNAYDVYFWGGHLDFSSITIALTPISLVRPANDDFNNRITLPARPSRVIASNCGATRESGEASGNSSVWYQWTADFTGSLHLEFDWPQSVTYPAFTIHRGTALNSLTQPLSQSVVAGETYQIRFYSFDSPGQFVFFIFNGDVFGSNLQIVEPSNGETFKSGTDVKVRALWNEDPALLKRAVMEVGEIEVAFTNTPIEYTFKNLPPGVYYPWVDAENQSGAQYYASSLFFVRPTNDHFVDRTSLTGPNFTISGNNSLATSEAIEPSPQPFGNASVWYTWTAPASGPVTVFTSSKGNAEYLGVYTGNIVSNLTQVAENWLGRFDGAQLTFNAIAGTPYQFKVTGSFGGEFLLTLASRPAPQVTMQPRLSTLTIGQSVDVTVQFSHNAGQILGLMLTDDEDTLTNITFAPTANGSYTFRYTATKEGNMVLWASALDTTGLLGFDGDGFAVGPPVPANDTFAQRFSLTDSARGHNFSATKEPGEPVSAGDSSVWWTWTAPFSGTAYVDTFGSSIDTVLRIFTGNAVNNLTLVAENDDSGFGPVQSTLSFDAVQGVSYQVSVESKGAQGYISLYSYLQAP